MSTKTFKLIVIALALFGCSTKVSDKLRLEQFGFDKKIPLILLDNKEISLETFRAIYKDSIGGISVLRHEFAREEYGAKGSDGVIIITSKSLRNLEDKETLRVLKAYLQGENEIDKYLFIIDGVPLSNENRNDFQDFDFEGIKSMSDLGVSTAKTLYGNRARENNIIVSTTE